jgi:acetyl/propionyl-CoA carboxylase alpha subunit
MLAKLIACGRNRQEAISKLNRALDELIIEGVPTTASFFKIVVADKCFLKGDFFTNFIERKEIVEKLSEGPAQTVCDVCDLDENDIAQIAFQIYQEMKKEKKSASPQKISNWILSQRSKMLDN